MKRIQEDQFLDLMTMRTDVRSVCKEPYRYSVEFHICSSHFLSCTNLECWVMHIDKERFLFLRRVDARCIFRAA